MAKLIKTDGSVTVVAPANGKVFTLEELRALVGGYIEIVDTPPWDGSRLAVCNEEGKYPENHPVVNEAATLIAERHRFNDYAVGDWLFADRAELQDDEDDDEEEDDMDPDDDFEDDEEEDEDLLV